MSKESFDKKKKLKAWERKKEKLDKQWKDGFKPLGKPGAVKNSIAIEYNFFCSSLNLLSTTNDLEISAQYP